MSKTVKYVGLDVHKNTIAVAVAEDGKRGEVREHGEIANTPAALTKLLSKLGGPGVELHICYEAGPCGYGIQRQVAAAGHSCVLVAPSLIPSRPGDRIKTDRRDAVKLARLHRAGELTPVWTQMHRRWLSGLRFAEDAHHIVLEDCIATVDAAKERRDRLTVQIEKRLADWTLAPVVEALQALRGMAMVAAATIVAELGDISRFSKAEQLMSYLGLVPSENSSGKRRRQGGITKAGNGAARRMLVEAAWSYRFPARISREQLLRQEQLAAPIRAIAWKAQERLCLQYRKLSRAGKPITTVTTAIARQLAGFVWAIAHEVSMPKA